MYYTTCEWIENFLSLQCSLNNKRNPMKNEPYKDILIFERNKSLHVKIRATRTIIINKKLVLINKN